MGNSLATAIEGLLRVVDAQDRLIIKLVKAQGGMDEEIMNGLLGVQECIRDATRKIQEAERSVSGTRH